MEFSLGSQGLLAPLFGGVLIGLAVTLMLFLNGRVTGISGIISGALAARRRDLAWRVAFIGGLLAGGIALVLGKPEVFTNTTGAGLGTVAFAGLLVGYGTVLGSGCTSGHGVCGVSRFSMRSILATISFIISGMLTVALVRLFLGGQT